MGSLFRSDGSLLNHMARTAIQKTPGAPVGSTGGASPASAADISSGGAAAVERAAQQQLLWRAGRSPTILTAPDTRGGAYTATKLGAGS